MKILHLFMGINSMHQNEGNMIRARELLSQLATAKCIEIHHIPCQCA
jgi:hypothetical protein